jgi:hypothetical protein
MLEWLDCGPCSTGVACASAARRRYFRKSCFPDRSPYALLPSQAGEAALNIGRLDRGHDFPTGKVSAQLVEKLIKLTGTEPFHRSRGWQQCPFCSIDPVTAPFAGKLISLGGAAISVRARTGTVFAAPDLICHHISDYAYKPPEEFPAAAAILEQPDG